FESQTSRRLTFGYLLLAPAVLYVILLVGAPFVFSLYLALSDANVGDNAARFVGLENFRAAFESDVFYIALRNSIGFTLVAAVFKGMLGTTLAFLLLQPFKGRKFIRGLVVIPFTLPISISVLGWKWMYDSQFSVINWFLSRIGVIGSYGSPDWPVWLGPPPPAAGRGAHGIQGGHFPFSAGGLSSAVTSLR